MLDASRAVGVVSGLLSPTEKDKAEAETRAEYVRIREQFARGQEAKVRTPLPAARANRFAIDWQAYARAEARASSARATFAAYDLADLARYIDWTPFFAGLGAGRPLSRPSWRTRWSARRRATSIADAQAMLKQIIDERWFEARGVVGFWPANADGDDIVVWTDETRTAERARLHTLRQQMAKGEGRAQRRPGRLHRARRGADYIGGFAVTAGHGEAEIAERFKAAGDDYSAILAAALADRLAEAFAEALHHKVRTELWGYAPDEPFDIDALLAETIPRHPPGARLSGPARPHREGAPCSTCWTPRPPPASTSPRASP